MNKFRCANRAKCLLAVYCVVSLAVVCFIFSQSMLSKQESGSLSERIAAFLKPILDPNGDISEATFHLLLRKAAHFTEFAALGFCVMGAGDSLGRLKGRRFVALPMLVTLLVAVFDEFLQYFTGRGSAVTDVVLDYTGALFGIGLFALLILILYRFKRVG